MKAAVTEHWLRNFFDDSNDLKKIFLLIFSKYVCYGSPEVDQSNAWRRGRERKERRNKHEKSSRSSGGVSKKCVTNTQTHKQDQVKSSSGTKK